MKKNELIVFKGGNLFAKFTIFALAIINFYYFYIVYLEYEYVQIHFKFLTIPISLKYSIAFQQYCMKIVEIVDLKLFAKNLDFLKKDNILKITFTNYVFQNLFIEILYSK